MRRVLASLVVLLLAAGPVWGQTAPATTKDGKVGQARPDEVLTQLRAWAGRGDYMLAQEPLLAVVREPIKILGLGGLDLRERMAVKEALTRVERRIRSTVRAVASGEISRARGRAEIGEAVEAYVSALRAVLQPER